MELRQIRQFIAVAETLSFRKAAERLHMAQPPLSAAIRRLEDELGTQLLERDWRIRKLSPAGVAFLTEGRIILQQVDRASTAARSAAVRLEGKVRLGFVDSIVNSFLPTLLRGFQASYPGVEIHLVEGTPPEQVSALRNNQIDLGILVLPVGDAPDLHFNSLMSDRMVVALPTTHRLVNSPEVTLSDLADEPWVLFRSKDGPGMHATILLACANAGFMPRVVQYPRQMQTTAGLVAGGIGVALVPAFYALKHSSGIVTKELVGSGSPILYNIALAYRQLGPVAKAMHDLALAVSLEFG